MEHSKLLYTADVNLYVVNSLKRVLLPEIERDSEPGMLRILYCCTYLENVGFWLTSSNQYSIAIR